MLKMKKNISKKNHVQIYLVVLFIVVLSTSIGFYFGKMYKAKNEEGNSLMSIRTESQENKDERKRKLIKKCGDIPRDKLEINEGHYVGVEGPEWSPDCKHIAYSVFNSGTVAINADGTSQSIKGNADEGIYVYDADTEKVKKVQLKGYESPNFERWVDSDLLLFSFLGAERLQTTYSIGFQRPISDINRF